MQTPILDKMIVRPPRTPEQLRIAKDELGEQRLRDREINPLTGHELNKNKIKVE